MIYVMLVLCIINKMDSIYIVFFFNQKTAYEMRISDWSSDVCSSDLTIMRIVSLPMPFGHRENRLTASCYPSPVRRAKTRTSGQRGTAMADPHRRSRIQRMAGRPSPLLLGIAANGHAPDTPHRFAPGLRPPGRGRGVTP